MYFSNIKKIVVDVNGDGIYDVLSNLTATVKLSDKIIDNAGFYDTITVQEGERPDHLSQKLYGTPIYHWTFLLLNKQIKNVWNDWPMAYSQLKEYCENKYEHLGAVIEEDLTNKFIVGEDVRGILSDAIGTVQEIHVNKGYLVIKVKAGTFRSTGESILGTNSQDSVIASHIKSTAYAPHHHVDDSTGEIVTKRSAGTTPFTYYDYEAEGNETNRNMKVIRPEHIDEVSSKFIKLMRQ
jgi:hypothetical protein